MSPKYMLDTNICIFLMKNTPKAVVERFSQHFVGEIVMSAITWAELQRGLGIYQSQADFDKLSAVIKVVPFDDKAGEMFGKMMQTGKFKACFDTLIACHALSLGLTIVTNNVDDFEGFGLVVEDWTK